MIRGACLSVEFVISFPFSARAEIQPGANQGADQRAGSSTTAKKEAIKADGTISNILTLQKTL